MLKEPNFFQISENGNINLKNEYHENKTIIKPVENNINNNENNLQMLLNGKASSLPNVNNQPQNNSENNKPNSPPNNIQLNLISSNNINQNNLSLKINNNNSINTNINVNVNNNNLSQLPNLASHNDEQYYSNINNFNNTVNNNINNNMYMDNSFNSNTKMNINETVPNNNIDENAIYLIDSDDEKEDKEEKVAMENKNNIINSNNQSQDKNNVNNVLNNEHNNSIINPNDYVYKKTENNLIIYEAKNHSKPDTNNNNTNNNINNNLIINNNENKTKINESNNENNNIKNSDRKLYYKRKLNSNKKFKFHGTEKEKINLQFFIGSYAQNQSLPTFIFGNDKFNYTPQYCRQYTKNYKGLIISFPGLIKAYNNGIIKKDLEHVCTYYFKRKRGKQNSLDIYVKDEKTLNDGVFLNDGIVNFYLKIIEDEYTYQNGQNNVLIQKSFFYNSLSNQQNSNCSNDFCYPDSCSFIKTKINVFSFKTLIIPICENYHWSLIIVNDIDKMKNIFTKNNLDEMNNNCCTSNNNNIEINEEECDYPEIFYLDSFYDLNTRRMTIILKYLFYEYQKIYSIQCNMAEFLKKNFDKIECYSLDVPKQNNSYDCGIYLLIYAELFLYDTNYFLKNSSKKYNSNNNDRESQIFKIGNTSGGGCNNVNTFNNFSNDNIINTNSINNNHIGNNVGDNNNMNNINNNINNILNEQNRNINEFIITSCNNNNNPAENNNENRIVLNNLNLIKINENKVNDNNNIIDNAKLKNDEIGQKENNPENPDNNKNINNKDDQSFDNIDIEIEEGENKIKNNEGNNLNENKNGENNHDEINNNQNENHPTAYNDMRYDQINEKSLRNWFSSDLVNNQRNKIKNLITELSKIEKEIINNNNKENIIKEKQSFVIKKYIEEQKREFDDYFSKLKE